MSKKVIFIDPHDDYDYADDLSGDAGGGLDEDMYGDGGVDVDLDERDFYEYSDYDDEEDEDYQDEESGKYEDTRRDIWSHIDWDKD